METRFLIGKVTSDLAGLVIERFRNQSFVHSSFTLELVS